MALRHIQQTRRAAIAIYHSMKFFIEKKRFNEYKLGMFIGDPKKLRSKKKVSWTFNIMLETNRQIITDPNNKYITEPLIPNLNDSVEDSKQCDRDKQILSRRKDHNQNDKFYDQNDTTSEESEEDEDEKQLNIMKKNVAIAKANMLKYLY